MGDDSEAMNQESTDASEEKPSQDTPADANANMPNVCVLSAEEHQKATSLGKVLVRDHNMYLWWE